MKKEIIKIIMKKTSNRLIIQKKIILIFQNKMKYMNVKKRYYKDYFNLNQIKQ